MPKYGARREMFFYAALLDEEEVYLQAIAGRLWNMDYDAIVESHTSLSYDNPILSVRGRDDFNVWTGGEESNFELQLVGDLTGKCETFIDIPWGRPVTAAYIIHRYMEDNPS